MGAEGKPLLGSANSVQRLPTGGKVVPEGWAVIELLCYRNGVMEKITANVRRLTVTAQPSGMTLLGIL